MLALDADVGDRLDLQKSAAGEWAYGVDAVVASAVSTDQGAIGGDVEANSKPIRSGHAGSQKRPDQGICALARVGNDAGAFVDVCNPDFLDELVASTA